MCMRFEDTQAAAPDIAATTLFKLFFINIAFSSFGSMKDNLTIIVRFLSTMFNGLKRPILL